MLYRETIHVAIAFDQNYLVQFYALLTSIFHNNKENDIHIHAIVSGLSESIKEKIRVYAIQNNSIITYYLIDEQIVSQYVLNNSRTSAVYYRLYFPLLVPAFVKRLLYLDTDTLVLNNLTELYDTNLENYPVGAVYDNWVKTAPYLGINQEGQYFNSGVLLIDVEKWKAQHISERSFTFLRDNPEKIHYVDQDALNAVLQNNWKRLDEKYNLMYSYISEGLSKDELKKYVADKVILHFTLQRPWNLLCRNRFRSLYFFYLKNSPAKKLKKIIDFKWEKIPDLVKIRLIEFYHDSPVIQKFWKSWKGTERTHSN